MLGEKLGLYAIPVTGEWEILTAPMCCNLVSGEADVNWQWRTNTNASKAILAGIGEQIVAYGYWPTSYSALCRFDLGEEICEVRGVQAGTLWLKCVR